MREITRLEVEKHSFEEDAWIIFKDKVYDVTPYISQHPGGLALLRYAGQDATKAIVEQPAHKVVPNFIVRLLEKYLIGKLSNCSLDVNT
ncbi:uncharacterized protein LOC143231116 [Tachypleus tridentatus]|uniref:uncharacterized protein LOC143231116 n=1 Tax=Tachypleus tridentatus TaxID=6853 RepID=UPI003FCEFB9C